MDTPNQSRSKSKTAVNWPSEVSYYLLGMLTNTQIDGKTSDNGLHREQWKCIADALNEQWKTSYDWEQTRNHYRVWKARLKYLVDLQRDSGMGWNEHENRFCPGPHQWADKQNSEQRYWKDHPVLPIHVQTLLWAGLDSWRPSLS